MTDLRKTPLRRLLLLSALMGGGSPAVERIALGNPLTFGTDLAKPLVSLEIPFTPIQEGSGDPSPQNIRSILPWNGLTVFGGGKNLLKLAESEMVSIGWNRFFPNPIKKAGTYTISYKHPFGGDGNDGSLVTLTNEATENPARIKDLSSWEFGQNESGGYATFTLTEDQAKANYMLFMCQGGGTTFSQFENAELQIEVGSVASAYEEYKPITDTDISFPSPVYGGTLDVVSGVLTVEWAGFSATWGDGESATDMGEGITRKVYPMVDYLTTGLANNMCNIARYTASENAEIHFYYSGSGSTNRKCRLFLPSDTPDTTVVTVVTKLSQTYEVQLTGEQITAIVGDNTIWSDADGSLTAVYLVSSNYADEHPVGGLGFGFGSGSSDPDDPDYPENPDESEEPIIDDSENNQIEGEEP